MFIHTSQNSSNGLSEGSKSGKESQLSSTLGAVGPKGCGCWGSGDRTSDRRTGNGSTWCPRGKLAKGLVDSDSAFFHAGWRLPWVGKAVPRLPDFLKERNPIVRNVTMCALEVIFVFNAKNKDILFSLKPLEIL